MQCNVKWFVSRWKCQLKVNTETRRWVCSSRVCNSKVCFQFGMESWQRTGVTKSTMPFQTFGAAIQNTHLAVSVRVHGTERRGASVDRRDRVVTWRCWSSSMYSGTEVDKALCVMTAILYWMCCWTGSHWRDCDSGLAWTHLRCWQMTLATLFWALCT